MCDPLRRCIHDATDNHPAPGLPEWVTAWMTGPVETYNDFRDDFRVNV
jgi:hypothetical protein